MLIILLIFFYRLGKAFIVLIIIDITLRLELYMITSMTWTTFDLKFATITALKAEVIVIAAAIVFLINNSKLWEPLTGRSAKSRKFIFIA